MGRRGKLLVATVVAGHLLMVPSAAAQPGVAPREATGGVDDIDDLDEARGRLDAAERRLDDVRATVRRTNDEVAALEIALTAASTELTEVSDQLVEARQDHEDAVAAERRATDDLAVVVEQLDLTIADMRDHRDRLADRVVETFKRGGHAPQELLVRGVAGAGDWHEVALALETVGRMTDDDRVLISGSVELTRDTAALQSDARALRTASIDAARAAAIEEARAVLVADLERRVEELEVAAASVLVPVVVDLDPFGPPPPWAAGLPGDGPSWAAAVHATSARYGIDGRLFAALVWSESNFRADAVSHAGALGLAQLMPGTARGLGVDPRDPLQNLDGGARYLREQLDRFGRVDLALAAYNAGPGRVQRTGGIPNIVETQLYVTRVLERYEQLRG